MRLIVLIFVFFLINLSELSAQGEASIWYFGANAGIDFNSGTVVALTDGELNTLEGCSTISNANGELLFYTDGLTVWDKTHSIMPNGSGLLGDPSSTQSGIIVPKPNNPNIYYIFTVDFQADADGLRYSEVDLNLNGGNGDITSNKNILLYTPTTEKISAIEHANGQDFWVVSHGWENSDFLAHLVTENGVSNTPISSTVGMLHGGSTDNSIGYLKISPNGERIALAKSFNDSFVELFDFDTLTGIVSNNILINNIVSFSEGAYGIEFSPDSSLLYVSDVDLGSNSSIVHQYNITLNNQADIINSDQIIFQGSDAITAIQLGVDQKIYLANTNSGFLDVIEFPNNIGVSANYLNRSLSLDGRSAIFGLPPFIQSFFSIGIQTENTCFGDETSFIANSTEAITSVFWDFGDGFTSTDINPVHTYSSAGTFTVNVTVNSDNDTRELSKEVTIYEVPIAFTIEDYYLCDDNSNDEAEIFDLNSKDVEILGSQSDVTFGVSYFESIENAENNVDALAFNYSNITNPQEVFARIYNIQNGNCYDITSFNLIVDYLPVANPVNDYIICDDAVNDNTELVNLFQFNEDILNGQTFPNYAISYHLSLEDAELNNSSLPEEFQTISNPQPIFVRIENTTNLNCYTTTFFNIVIDGQLIAYQPDNMYICDDESRDSVETFMLTNQNDQVINGQTGGYNITYHLTSEDANLNENSLPSSYQNTENPQEVFVRIENDVNENCYDVSSFFIEVMDLPEIEMDQTWYICTNETATIVADSGYDAYLWSTGETTESIVVDTPGSYTVTVVRHYNTLPFISCESSLTLEVIESDEAVMQDIIIQDWTVNNNTISVFIEGIGDYEYSIDGLNYQDDNVFSNLEVGDYIVYVRDKFGCGIITEEVFVMHYPKYFTPNSDGYNDNWQILFSETEPDLIIYIYDKYGKLLKQLSPKSLGWDGTFNGNPLPTSDYWFVVNRPRKSKQYKGHFTLKR